MTDDLIKKGYIPLDKSWIIRMGVLDLLNGYEDTVQFLSKQKQLSTDLKALQQAILDWSSGIIHVGESGTLYRFLKFASWKLKLNKKFILSGTLEKRKICDDPKIINYSLQELLELDNRTSQWASAAVLLGSRERVAHPPYKLKLTYEAVSHWKERRSRELCWEPRFDETILRQAEAFVDLLKTGKTSFVPKQPEDYCFACAFGLVKGDAWPSLRSHETNRIEEMKKMLRKADKGTEIDSVDHRVVQAVAMRQKLKGMSIKVKYPEAVNKSWPQFWKFLSDSPNL